MDALVKLIGMNVRKLRKAQGLSQERLGSKAGFDYRYIGFLEQARINPTMKTLGKVAAALNCTVRDLFPSNPELAGNKKPANHKETAREKLVAHIMKDLNKADEKTLLNIKKIVKITVG